MDININFINERKKALGLTNQMIAEKTGITLSTLDKITSGANTNPKLSTMRAISRVLNCKLDDFDAAEPAFSSVELDLVEKYRALDLPGQTLVRLVVDHETERVQSASHAASEAALLQRVQAGAQESAQPEGRAAGDQP